MGATHSSAGSHASKRAERFKRESSTFYVTTENRWVSQRSQSDRLLIRPKYERIKDDLAQKDVTRNRSDSANSSQIVLPSSDVKNVTTDDIKEALRTISFFALFEEQGLNKLAQCFSVRSYSGGDYIIKKGDTSRDFYVVYAGEVEIGSYGSESEIEKSEIASGCQHLRDSMAPTVVGTETAGGYFGEVSTAVAHPLMKKDVKEMPLFWFVRVRLNCLADGIARRYEIFVHEKLMKYFVGLRSILRTSSKEGIRDQLKKVPFFATLENDKIEMLTNLFRWETFHPGSVICREGEPGDCMYIIMSGSVQVFSQARQLGGHDSGKTNANSSVARKKSESAIAKGILSKQGCHFKTWKQRYCVLRGVSLEYYECEGVQCVPEAVQRGVLNTKTLSGFATSTYENSTEIGGPENGNTEHAGTGGSNRSLARLRSTSDNSSTTNASSTTPECTEAPTKAYKSTLISLSKEQRREQCMSLIGNLRPSGKRILKGCFEVVAAGSWKGEDNGFVVETKGGRLVAFQSRSNTERDAWLKAIVAALRINRSRSGDFTQVYEERKKGKVLAKQHKLNHQCSLRMLKMNEENPNTEEDKKGIQWWRMSKVPGLGKFLNKWVIEEKKDRGSVGSEGDSDDEEERQYLVRDLQAGSYFGEIGLVTNQPRNATVVAKEQTGVIKLSDSNFQTFINVVPHLRDEINNMVIERSAANLRALKVPFLEGFTEEKFEKLAQLGRLVRLKPKEIVFRQGDVGNTFYIVLQGLVDVRQIKVGQESTAGSDGSLEEKNYGQRINTLKAGSYFGEIALLTQGERMATIIAIENTSLLELGREHFQALFVKEAGDVNQRSRRLSVVSARRTTQSKRRALSKRKRTTGSRTSVEVSNEKDFTDDLLDDVHNFSEFELKLFHKNCEMEQVLRHSRGIQYFREALQKEHSEENLNFWEATRAHRMKYLPLLDKLPLNMKKILLAELERNTSHEVAILVMERFKTNLERCNSPSAYLYDVLHVRTLESDDEASDTENVAERDEVIGLSELFAKVNECCMSALEIHTKYVVDTSRQQVNIPSEIRSSLDSCIKVIRQFRKCYKMLEADNDTFSEFIEQFNCGEENYHTFNQAFLNLSRLFVEFASCYNESQKEIRDLMNRDNFRRFKDSVLFDDLMKEIQSYNTGST